MKRGSKSVSKADKQLEYFIQVQVMTVTEFMQYPLTDMAIDWTTLLQTLTSNAALIGGAGYVVTKIAEKSISDNSQRIKDERTHSNTQEIERLRSELALAQKRGEKQFEILHVKRAEAIDDVYKRLILFQDAYIRYSSPVVHEEGKTTDQLTEDMVNAAREFSDVFNPRRIYMSASLCDLINKSLFEPFYLAQDLALTRRHIFMFEKDNDPDLILRLRTQAIEQHQAVLDMVRIHLPKARKEIEHEFRLILGVEDSVPEIPMTSATSFISPSSS